MLLCNEKGTVSLKLWAFTGASLIVNNLQRWLSVENRGIPLKTRLPWLRAWENNDSGHKVITERIGGGKRKL